MTVQFYCLCFQKGVAALKKLIGRLYSAFVVAHTKSADCLVFNVPFTKKKKIRFRDIQISRWLVVQAIEIALTNQNAFSFPFLSHSSASERDRNCGP